MRDRRTHSSVSCSLNRLPALIPKGPFGIKREKTVDRSTVIWVRQYLSVSAASTVPVKLHIGSKKTHIIPIFAFFVELEKYFPGQKLTYEN